MVFHLRRAFSSLLIISLIVIAESQALNRQTVAPVSSKNQAEESLNSSNPQLKAWSSDPLSSSPTTSDEKCDCGENSTFCGFLYDRRKYCDCKAGFADFFNKWTGDNECRKCDCGNGTYSCEFNRKSLKKCDCGVGYAAYRYSSGVEDEFCKECSCGEDTVTCKFNSRGGRYCICGGDSISQFHPVSGELLCKKCNCGPFSLSCTVVWGKQECKCIKGYYPQYNSSIQTAECLKAVISEDGKSTPPSGWEVATYVLAATLVVLLIVQLIIIKRNQKRAIVQNEEAMRPM